MTPALLIAWALTGASPRIAVMPVVKSAAGEISADQLHERVERIVARHVGVTTISRTAFLTTPQEAVRRLGDCALDPTCLARAGRYLEGDLLLVVLANTSVQPPLVATILIDITTQKLIYRATSDAKPGQPTADQLEPHILAALKAAGFAKYARLQVAASPPDALVTLSPPSERTVDGAYRAVPGVVTVRVRRDGYESAERQVDLTSGAMETVDIRLVQEASVFDSPIFWVGVGVGVLAIAATVVVVTSRPDECLCVATRCVRRAADVHRSRRAARRSIRSSAAA